MSDKDKTDNKVFKFSDYTDDNKTWSIEEMLEYSKEVAKENEKEFDSAITILYNKKNNSGFHIAIRNLTIEELSYLVRKVELWTMGSNTFEED